MKPNTPDLMKFKRLQRRLGASRRDVVGILELLWISTSKNAPRGDIGRFDNEEIAIETEWQGDPDELVAALVQTRWLDKHDECRLVVHDWPEHCPRWVKANVVRHMGGFVVQANVPNGGSLEELPIGASPVDPPTIPSQSKPNQTNPAAAEAAAGEVDFGPLRGTGRVADAASRLGKALSKRRIKGFTTDWIWKHAAVGELLKPGLIADIASKVLEGQVHKPQRYITKALQDECRDAGISLANALRSVPPCGEEAA